jgi:hypothetical protein
MRMDMSTEMISDAEACPLRISVIPKENPGDMLDGKERQECARTESISAVDCEEKHGQSSTAD